MSCDPCMGELVGLQIENERLRRLIMAMASDAVAPMMLSLDRDGPLWCAEVVGLRGSYSYGGNLVEATRRAKAAALRSLGDAVERGERTQVDALFTVRERLH